MDRVNIYSIQYFINLGAFQFYTYEKQEKYCNILDTFLNNSSFVDNNGDNLLSDVKYNARNKLGL